MPNNIKSLDKYRKGKSNVDIGAWVSWTYKLLPML